MTDQCQSVMAANPAQPLRLHKIDLLGFVSGIIFMVYYILNSAIPHIAPLFVRGSFLTGNVVSIGNIPTLSLAPGGGVWALSRQSLLIIYPSIPCIH